jgi:UDP-glucuronate 4-epimerase
MKYLITGSSGFIGFHLAKKLLKNKNNIVFGLDSLNKYYSITLKKKRTNILKKKKNFIFSKINLCNYCLAKKKILEIKPDFIIHLAGQPGVIHSFKDPQSYKSNNIVATQNLLKIISFIKIKKFIFSSSSSVYGDQKIFPIKENFKLNPINYYAITKLKCEHLIKTKLKKLKTPYIIYRLFTVYGPMGRPDMFIYSAIKKIKKSKLINLYNNGQSLRDFTYIDDVINVLFKSITKNANNNSIVNICASKPIKIIKITKIIGNILKKKIKIKNKKNRNGEIERTHGSNYLLKKNFKIRKFININQGLKNIIYQDKNI